MPILPITDGLGNLIPKAEIELTGASAYPRDEQKRFEFVEILCCRNVIANQESLAAVDGHKEEFLHLTQMLEVLMTCPVSPSAAIKNGLKRLISGHVAGEILNQNLALRARVGRPVPLEVIVEVLSELYSSSLFPPSTASSESMFSKAWARYRSASHLHAMHGWVNFHFDIELINLPAWDYPEFYRYLLSFAEHRRRQAESLGILDVEETWRVPSDYELIDLSFGIADEPLPEEVFNVTTKRPPLRTGKSYVEGPEEDLKCPF